jgi:signal transduction histidine kinase
MMDQRVQASAPADAAARPVPRRLAVRLAWLMIIALLVAEACFLVPSMVRRRTDWLDQRITEAQLAAFSVAATRAGMVDQPARDTLLRLIGVEAIFFQQSGQRLTVLAPTAGLPEATTLDLARETTLDALLSTAASLFDDSDRLIAVTSASPLDEGDTVIVVLHQRALHERLALAARRSGTISLIIAVAAGMLLYVALLFLLVRPLRRLTASIAAFRDHPERSVPIEAAGFSRHGRDEISTAARELAAMQQELRAALSRNARLAALGTAMAKVNHDLRGILAPAMLTAERLQMHADPAIQRAGDVLLRSVERAAELTRRTLEFTREAPVVLPRQRVALHPLVAEAAEEACAACPALAVANHVASDIEIEADRESLARVLGNLLRNAGEAEARCVSVTAAWEGAELVVTVADDGPGLPEAVRAALFRPFVRGGRSGSTGLGLAIVYDLMQAHGGDVALLDSGPGGTQFRLSLPAGTMPPGA